MLVGGCDPGDVVLLAPETSGGTPSLSVHAVLDSPYVDVAKALGWTGGIPGARVRVHVNGDPYADSTYWHTTTTDSTGMATFSDLLPGMYEIEVTRPLTAAETARTGGARHLVAGGRRIYLPSAGPVEAWAAPDAPAGLVFSEYALLTPPEWETGGGTYPDATYIEIYNNSDTTIYLDHKYLGKAFLAWDLSYMPCAQTEVFRNDPDGIWVEKIFRFPGRGSDHPLAPGRTAVIAKSAIDHRGVLPTLPDLSHADFELGGYQGADNPDVPNLEDVGLRPQGAGATLVSHMFLAEPVDLASLPRQIEPYTGHAFVRIPRALILDARSGTYERVAGDPEMRFCLDEMYRVFEYLPLAGEKWPDDFEKALTIQRRVLLVLPDGRKRLQDTNTSMVDFLKAPLSPGWIPDP